MKPKIRKKLYAFTAVIFWLAVWHIAATRVNLTVLLPTPFETIKVFLSLASEVTFWEICFVSLRNVFLGAVTGIILGVAIAVLSYISEPLKFLFLPIMSLVKATPIASIIILFLVWIGKNQIPFFVSLMMVVPIVASNVLEGLENINKELWEVTKVYKFSFIKSWKILYRHCLLPYFVSALRSGVALAWKAGIAAEVLCTPDNSIGEMLYESKLYLETPILFAWTLAVIILSFILEKAMVWLSFKLLGGDRYGY